MNARPRTVAFVLPSLTAGGAERVLITLMNGLDRAAFTPVFIGINGQGPLGGLIAADIPRHILTPAGRVGKSLPRLYRTLRRLKPDIVVSTMAHMNFGVLLLKPFFPRTRFIVREAITPSFILQDRGMAEPVIRTLYRTLYPCAHTVVSPAGIIVGEFRDVLRMKTGNHRILPNPVNLPLIRREEHIPPPRAGGDARTVHFIAAGRLHRQKGFDRLLDILPRLPAAMDWRLTILGEGPEREALEKAIEEKGLKDRVALPGLSDHPWPSYAAADAFLLPSRSEGLPNVALEALACGTPVIATAESGGIGDIARAAHRHQGAVTVAPDMDAFLAAMANVTAQPPGAGFRPSLLPPAYTPEDVATAFRRILQEAAPAPAPAEAAAGRG